MTIRKYDKNALDNAKKLRLEQTDVENIMWFNLRNKKFNGIKFRRQVPIGKYIVDFACMSKKLIIELDGSQHIDNMNYDKIRTEYLENNGYKIIRIFNNEVLKDIQIVLEHISKCYEEL